MILQCRAATHTRTPVPKTKTTILLYNFETADKNTNNELLNYANGLYDLSVNSSTILTTLNYKYGTASLLLDNTITTGVTYKSIIYMPLAVAGNGWSISMWFRLNTPSPYNLCNFFGFNSTKSANSSCHINILSDNRTIEVFFAKKGNGGSNDASYPVSYTYGQTTLFDNTWRHLCIVFRWTSTTNMACYLYFNSSPVSANPIASCESYNLSEMRIGRRTDNVDNGVNGNIDQFAFYKIPLTTDNVTTLYNGGIV